MGKYDDTIGGGKLILDVEEVLNEESAKKVDDRIKKQKADLETPIEINVKSDKAENRLKELAKAAKQVKADLQEAIFSQKSFGEISKIVSKYELLKKQIKAIAPEVSKNNSSLKEGNQILKDTKKLVDQLTVSQEKLNKTRKTKKGDSTKIETKNTKELIEVADDATKTQEKAAKTKLRAQQQVNADSQELIKEPEKMYETASEIMSKSRNKHLGKDWRHEIYSAKDSKQAAQVLAEIDAQTKLLEEDARQAKLEYNGLMTAISSYIGTSLVNKSDFQKAIKDSWRQGEKEAAAKLFESYQERFPDGKFDPSKQFGDEWTSNFEKNLANANRSLTIWRSQIKSAAEEYGKFLAYQELTKEYNPAAGTMGFRYMAESRLSGLQEKENAAIAAAEKAARLVEEAQSRFATDNLVTAQKNLNTAIDEYNAKLAESNRLYAESQRLHDLDTFENEPWFDKYDTPAAKIMEVARQVGAAEDAVKDYTVALKEAVRVYRELGGDMKLPFNDEGLLKEIDIPVKITPVIEKPELLQHVEVLESRDEMYDAKTIAQKRKAAEQMLRDQFSWYQDYAEAYENDGTTSDGRIFDVDYNALNRQKNMVQACVALYEKYGGSIDKLSKKLQNFIALHELAGQYQLATDEYNESLKLIEAQTVATEKLVETRLKLTPKNDGSGAYTALDGKYEVQQDAEGWKVHQRDNAGMWNLIGTYERLEDVRNDASLLTREEIVYTDEIIQEIRVLKEAYSEMDQQIRGHVDIVNKYLEVLRKVKSGAMGAADAIGQLNETARSKGLMMPDNKAAEEKMAKTIALIGELQTKYGTEKFGEIFGDIGAIDVSNAEAVYDLLIAKEEEYGQMLINRANTIAEFTSKNTELIGQFSGTDNWSVVETKIGEISAGIYKTGLSLEEANRQLKEFVSTLSEIDEGKAALAKITLGSSGKTLAGTKPINFKYAVMSVEDLVMSHDAYGVVNPDYPTELQPRDRNRMASKTQILGMVKNLLPELLVASPTAQNGSPIVSNDGIVVGGNARSAALAEAYATGHADGYKSYITEHASEFGLDPNNMPKNPVLVRVVDIDGGLDTLAKQLNESTTAGYSTTEQALINEELIMKVISKLNIDESANLNSEANKDFVRSFMSLLPDDQKNEMMTKDGSLSAVGLVKVKQALFGAAYGSKEMLENLEQISPEFLNISNALMASAAQAADIRYSVENGVLNDLGVISTILNGVDLLKTARHNNYNIEGYLSQTSLLDSGYAAEDIAIGKFLEANVRNATQLKNMIDIILDFARGAGDPNQISLGGFSEVTLSDVIKGAFTKYAEQYQKKIDYDKLIDGHSPAEVGSRSDKRVDRIGDFEAESKMNLATEANTKTKQEQASAISDAAEKTEAQAEAEKQLGEEVRKVADAKERQVEASKKAANASNNVSVEEIITRDVNKALEKLRSAKNNETSLFTLKGVFKGDDLIDQAQAMVKNIAEQANLSLGKFNVKDKSDIIKVQLYNEELKVTVDQMYKLRAATEDAESAQLELVSQSFNQNVKALNENNFDVEGIQQRALASIEKVRSSLHGLEYDLTDLENVAKDISSQDDFNKFNNQLKAAQDNIQAIKNSTVSKSSMNPLANMQRDMQNANIEIKTMRLKLEKFGDIQGVAEAKKMLTDMADAAKQYNNATDAQGQQAAYNQYSNLRSSFKAQTEYINAAKALNDSQKSEEKKTDPIREQYQSILDLINKINTKSTEITKYQSKDGGSGIFAGYIEQLQSEKARLVSELKGITDEINSTLGSGFIQGKEFSVPFASFLDDSGAISSFLNDTRTQASLTTEEIEKLVAALQKSQNIDVQAATKVTEQFKSVQETYKRLSGLTGLDKGNANYQALVGVFGQIMKYKESLSSDPTSWTPEESSNLQTLIDQFTKYGNVLADVGEKEARYFAGKQKYTEGTTYGSALQNISEETNKLNDTRKQLEDAAKSFAKDSGAGDAFITGFTQSADGISRLDFSVFDSATGSLRNFRMEMGSVTEGMFVTETTVSKSLANIQAAQKQLQSVSSLLGRLDASGVNVGEGNAPAQVAKLLAIYKQLSAEISKGDGADQNKITNLTKDLQLASRETEKCYKQMLQMNEAIANEQAKSIGRGDPKGNVYNQLVEATKEYIGVNQNATLEFGRFDAATNTLNASLTHTNGTVETFKVQMSGLNGQMTAQQTGVKQVANSWDQFKASVSSTAKQLATAVVGYNVFYKAMAEIRKGVGYVKEIDLAMTELKKVTDETEASYKKFLDTAANRAGEIGSTVSDFTEATANFARLGSIIGSAPLYSNI